MKIVRGSYNPGMNPFALNPTLQYLVLRIRRDRSDAHIYAWAVSAVRGDVTPSTTHEVIHLNTCARRLHNAVTAHNHNRPDDDDYALAFATGCMALGIPVKLLFTADERSPRLRVGVCIKTVPDEKEPWITHDTWEAFESALGPTPWPTGAEEIWL